MIFRFLNPWMFVLLALLPLLVLAWLWIEKKGRARVVFSDVSAFREVRPSARARLRWAPAALRVLAAAVLVAAIARPQYGNRTREIMSKGIDVMIAVDVSTSMSQQDLEPNRLGAALRVINRFIQGREEGLQNDRIGLVVFSRVAFTQCPLTVDYAILKKIVSRTGITRKEFDGTAIGTAIATALGRLENSKAKSKVLILVTDGENNTGLDPMTAASAAKALGVRIYTIGVVPQGLMQKVQDRLLGIHFVPGRPPVDETQMKQIAKTTGGRYFRAADEKGLVKVFDEIDKLEKTEVKVNEFYRYQEAYVPWAAAALILLILEQVLARTVWRRVP